MIKRKQLHGIDDEERVPIVVLTWGIVLIDISVYLASELVSALCDSGSKHEREHRSYVTPQSEKSTTDIAF